MSEPCVSLASLAEQLTVRLQGYTLAGRTAGLVIVHEVNGFCTVGAGNLVP
jgi:hypothetical protein